MWVYTPENNLPARPAPQKAAGPALSAAGFSEDDDNKKRGASPYGSGHAVLPPKPSHAHAAAVREQAAVPAILYVAGLCLAGGVLACVQGSVKSFLCYYAQNWTNLFFQPDSVLHLFSTLFLSGILSMTLVLVFGFCAFGTPLLYALLLCKGLGSGLLSLELFRQYGWKGILLYICFLALSDVYLAWSLCLLSARAVCCANRLFAGMLRAGSRDTEPAAKMLLSRYLSLCVLQILSCGFSAILAGYLIQHFTW